MRIDLIHYHDDFDGVVAAAMLIAWQNRELSLKTISYENRLEWSKEVYKQPFAVVDFLYHPDATVWIDHHDTSFQMFGSAEKFQADKFHVWDTSATSCPRVIMERKWFQKELKERFLEWTKWADIIDSALYESSEQALDLDNPYLRFASTIPFWVYDSISSEIIHKIAEGDINEVLLHPVVEESVGLVSTQRSKVEKGAVLREVQGGNIVFMNQGHISAPYLRYLPYREYPNSLWSVGIYLAKQGFVVSVGENPWNSPGDLVHLGKLCSKFGGGGRKQTAGIPAKSLVEAEELAEVVIKELLQVDVLL